MTSTDRWAPLIFVTGADAKSAQMFALAHIWLDAEGISGFEGLSPGGSDVEDWCGAVAAELVSSGPTGRSAHRRARSGGGAFFGMQNARVGAPFATEVRRAALEGGLGFKEAYRLTGLYGGRLQEYARRLGVALP